MTKRKPAPSANRSKVRTGGGSKAPWKLSKRASLLFAASFGVLGMLFAFNAFAAPPPGKGGSTTSVPSLSLTPSSQKVSVGVPFTLEIWEDSQAQGVNAVQANLTYPADKIDVVSIDSTASAFPIEAQSVAANGVITIARGSTSPISGSKLVARLQLQAKPSAGKFSISFNPNSEMLLFTTSANILGKTVPGRYTAN